MELDPWKDLSYILYTGGTTGFPKGVPGNHIGMTSYVNDVTEDVAGQYLKEGEDVYLAVNPLFHIMALGLFMAVGLNKGNTHAAYARAAGGCDPGMHPAVRGAMDAGGSGALPDDP